MPMITTISHPGYSLRAGEGERLWIVGDTMTFKAIGDSTAGGLVLLENLTAPGGGPPPHVHTREDEFFYVLDGELELLEGERWLRAGAGSFVFLLPSRFVIWLVEFVLARFLVLS